MGKQSPITPTVGRIVLVRGPATYGLEVPAIVTRVWSDNCINVHVFRDGLDSRPMTSLLYNEDAAITNISYAFWRWMPYQVAKAAEDGAKAAEQVQELHPATVEVLTAQPTAEQLAAEHAALAPEGAPVKVTDGAQSEGGPQ